MERLCRGGAPPRHAVRHGYLSAPRRSENPARRFGLVARALGQHDVVVADLVLDEALRVGRDLLVADHRVQRREGRNEVEVAALQVPEVSDFIPYNVQGEGPPEAAGRRAPASYACPAVPSTVGLGVSFGRLRKKLINLFLQFLSKLRALSRVTELLGWI